MGTKDRRRHLAGAAAIEKALARGESLRLILVDGDADLPDALRLLEPARAAGVPVQTVGARHFERLRPHGAPGGALAFIGEQPGVATHEVLARDGAAWLLVGVAYPGNAGAAIRTAEVSGAAGVFLDTAFDHERRREALRASMRSDRFLPVVWERSATVVEAARAAGRRVVGIEDVGSEPPWALDLTGPLLFVVGGEADGIPTETLDACDTVVRIPMHGFLRSYNLQVAMAAVAAERLRQLAQ